MDRKELRNYVYSYFIYVYICMYKYKYACMYVNIIRSKWGAGELFREFPNQMIVCVWCFFFWEGGVVIFFFAFLKVHV